MLTRQPTLLATCIFIAVFSLFAESIPVQAQSPFPNGHLVDVAPGSAYPSGWQGVIVEGLGQLGSCPYSTSSVETSTVNFIQMPNDTIT